MIIDTHTHIYLNDFADTIDTVIRRANDVGVQKFYLPAIDSETFEQILQLEEKYPAQCFAMAGLHPCSVKENYQEELAFVKNNLEKRKYVAIGEIGLDYYWDKTFAPQQIEAFTQQMQWAVAYNVPISIHTRNAMGETIEAVKPFAAKGLRGIFHCFGGSVASAKEIIKMGFYLGIGGVVTYKNAGLAEVLTHIDVQHLVLETDAPYLTPLPFRGKQNEPSYLQYIIDKIAVIKNCTTEEVAKITTANAIKVFGNN
jgi:TatD DNase family protein